MFDLFDSVSIRKPLIRNPTFSTGISISVDEQRRSALFNPILETSAIVYLIRSKQKSIGEGNCTTLVLVLWFNSVSEPFSSTGRHAVTTDESKISQGKSSDRSAVLIGRSSSSSFEIYAPSPTLRARSDNSLVIGIRGVGKSFWPGHWRFGSSLLGRGSVP